MKNNILRRVPYILMAVLLVLTAFAFLRLPRMTSRVEALQASKEETDLFLEDPKAHPFENEGAIKEFEKEPTFVKTDALFSIRAPEGFYLRSYSKHWDEGKLQQLYEELKKNKHGEEMSYLYEVIVYAESDEYAAATHQGVENRTRIRLRFPALRYMKDVSLLRDEGIITLYNGDALTTVESMARSLSHEYGHHYTLYHMFNRLTTNESDYVKKRNIDDGRLRWNTSDRDEYMEKHGWYLIEIAAEDYVQLMGSPTVWTVTNYVDIQQQINGAKDPTYYTMNGHPQENLEIPLATEVEGLAEYFYSFIDEDAPEYSSQYERKPIEIAIQKRPKTYSNLVGGAQTIVAYELTWNMPYEEDVVYTLVAYNPDSAMGDAIRTVKTGEKGSAMVGTVSRISGNKVLFWNDNIGKGKQKFRVVVQFPDKTIQISEPLDYEF